MKSLITKSRKYHQIYSNYHTVSARIVYIQYKICFAFVRNLHTCQNQYDALYRYRKIHLVTFDENATIDFKQWRCPAKFCSKKFLMEVIRGYSEEIFPSYSQKKSLFTKSHIRRIIVA